MQVWSFSSGSSGNCYLVREGRTLLLLEAGLGIRKVASELGRLGFSLADISAIVASHEHTDHWSSAEALARRSGVPVLCSPGTWCAGASSSSLLSFEPLPPGRSLLVGSITVEAFPLPHDSREPTGFLLRSADAALCLATDMGTAGEEVVERARSADLVILESNHDVNLLTNGPYATHLKARILSDRGHLSNEAAGRALVRMAEGRPRSCWLAHLSDTNNSPGIALKTVRAALLRHGLAHLKVDVALRDRPSLFWDSEAAAEMVQLSLF